MERGIKELISNCVRLESERNRLFLIQLAFVSPKIVKKYFDTEIPVELRSDLKEEGKKIGGADEVEKKYDLISKSYEAKLSETAELLEEESFVVENFQDKLDTDQFKWLSSRVVLLKDHLKGMEI